MTENKQFYIKINGEPIEVTEEIYRAYKRPAWAEKKRREVRAEHELSLDLMKDEIASSQKLLEDIIVGDIVLADALETLSLDDRQLINAIFFEGLTERDYAAKIGISQKNVNKKKQRILLKLKNFFIQ